MYRRPKKMQFNFTDVLLWYYGRQHASAAQVATFRLISNKNTIQVMFW